jgi:hypothetical protein
MKIIMIAAAGGLALLVSGCMHAVDTSGAPSFGQAVETNIAAQAGDRETDPSPPQGSGAQGERAQLRYQSGQTRALAPTASATTNLSTTPD